MVRRILVAITIAAAGLLSIAVAMPFLDERPAPLPDRVAAKRVVVEKSKHLMTLYLDGHEPRTYRVALGRGGMARKQSEGDNRVPEGNYRLTRMNRSSFHRALHISYPEGDDDRVAHRTGTDIEIHGLPNALSLLGRLQSWHRLLDWTAGCVAVTDSEMDEIHNAVHDDTPIEIKP
jgi:murein L,D-transpeptidase YafK